MSKTREALGAELQATVFESLDGEAFERLEETLIYADVGAPATAQDRRAARDRGRERRTRGRRGARPPPARAAGGDRARERRHDPAHERPTVILVTGVNGSGKTTTIGKIAWHLQKELGRSVLLAAGDTFAPRPRSSSSCGPSGPVARSSAARRARIPAAVVFDAIEAAAARGNDVVIATPPGRLHTQQHLMEELRRCAVIAAQRRARRTRAARVDATTGQNGLRQARQFPRPST